MIWTVLSMQNGTDVESYKLANLFIHDALAYHHQSSKKAQLSSYKEERGHANRFDELTAPKFLETTKS